MATITEVITVGQEIQDKLVQYMAVTGFNGADSYNNYYIDAGIVYSLVKALEFEELYPDSLTFFEREDAINKINEYYFVLELDDPTYIGSAYEVDTTTTVVDSGDWQRYTIPITSSGETVFTGLPFDIDEISDNTTRLRVNGNTTAYNTNPSEEAYHIIDTTLYWHGGYELKIGDIVIIEWKE